MTMATAVSLVSGSVELIDEKNPRKRTRENFQNVLVAGSTHDECLGNFSYAKAFKWKDRKPIRELEKKGLVRLVQLDVVRQVGGWEPDVNEQYI